MDVLTPRVVGRNLTPPPPIDPAFGVPAGLSLYPPAADQWRVLPGIACPTLIIRATKGSQCPRPTAERMAEVIPDGRMIEITGSNHRILHDRPAELIATPREFCV